MFDCKDFFTYDFHTRGISFRLFSNRREVEDWFVKTSKNFLWLDMEAYTMN